MNKSRINKEVYLLGERDIVSMLNMIYTDIIDISINIYINVYNAIHLHIIL